jgi:hypothetical protein
MFAQEAKAKNRSTAPRGNNFGQNGTRAPARVTIKAPIACLVIGVWFVTSIEAIWS